MYHSNGHTNIIISNIFNQLNPIPSKVLVAQCVHPFRVIQRSSFTLICVEIERMPELNGLNWKISAINSILNILSMLQLNVFTLY